MLQLDHHVLYVGNTVLKPWHLEKANSANVWDVSAASAITLSVATAFGETVATLVANPNDPGADWVGGIVIFALTPVDVTAAIRSLRYTLTVEIAGQSMTIQKGAFEVRDRPGFPLPNVGDVFALGAIVSATVTII